MINSSHISEEKESIVAEYLLGNHTYRQLGKKHNVDYRIIHSWVMKFKGKLKSSSPKITFPIPETGKKEC